MKDKELDDANVNNRLGVLFKVWSQFYEHPLPQRLFFSKIHQIVLEKTLDLQPETILDVACGRGNLIKAMRRRWPTAEIFGMEASTVLVAQAEAKVRDKKLVQFLAGNVYDMPFQNERFEMITSTIGTQFFLDLPRALAELRRVMKPAGVLVLASMSNSIFQHVPGPWKEQVVIPDARFRSADMQISMMQDAGLEVITTQQLPLSATLYILRNPDSNSKSA